MGVPGHILQNAFGLPEQLRDVFHAAGKGSADMSALLRQRLGLIVGGGVISVKEHLGLLEDGEIVEIPLIFHHRLTEIGQQGGTDAA